MNTDIRVRPGGRTTCRTVIDLPLTASQAWGQLRDFQTYAAHDAFHGRIIIEGGVPRVGADLKIEHRYFGLRIWRHGRILRWKEGVGFAFSDFSDRPRLGFPHVLSMTVFDGPAAGHCRLVVRVAGLWTAPTPRWMARIWLRWVFVVLVQHTRNALLAHALRLKKQSV